MFASLTSRLIALVVLFTIPGVIVLMIYLDKARDAAVEQHRHTVIELTEKIAYSQQQLVSDIRYSLNQLALSTEVNNPTAPSCSRFLTTLVQFNPTFKQIGVALVNGELVCASSSDVTENLAASDIGKQAQVSHQFAIGFYRLKSDASQLLLQFAYPLIDSAGQLTALVVGDISVDWWYEALLHAGLPEDSMAFIYDTNGTIVARYPDSALLSLEPAQQSQHVEYLVKGNDFATQLIKDKAGVTRVFTQATLHRLQSGKRIVMHIGIPVDQVLHQVNQQLLYIVGLFFISVSLFFTVALMGLRASIINPLRKFTAATDALLAGKLPEFDIKHGSEEITALQKRFLLMAETRIKAEQDVLSMNEELNAVFNAIPDLFFKLNKQGVILDFKGGDEGDLYMPQEAFLSKKMADLVPESLAPLLKKNLDSISAHSPLCSWEYPLEIKGKRQFFEARLAQLPRSENIIMVVRNITKRKDNEESMRLASMVYQNSSEGMAVTEPDGTIIDINPAFTKLTGYGFTEVVDKKISILSSGTHDPSFYQSMWDALEENGRWQGEINNKRKNGEIFSEWLTIDTIFDDDGNVLRRIAMFIDITEKKKTEQLIWHQAHYDQLTGLPNRNMLYDRLEQEVKKSHRSRLPMALLFLDLDHFKEVNDTLGHDMGDLLLQKASKRLRSCVREVDTVARQGGDEFTIILSELHQHKAVEPIVKNILCTIEKPFQLKEELAYVTASIGITFYPTDAHEVDDLLKTADQAMYAAKQRGRNCFHYFTSSMQEGAMARMQLIKDLRKAREQNEFSLYLQPIVSLETGKICKAEALLRWHHPQRGVVCPAEFISTAEDMHMLIGLGNWIFNDALKKVVGLRSIFGAEFQISINLSPVQFLTPNSGIEYWPEQLAKMDLPGNAVAVEITEGFMLELTDVVTKKLIAFREAGMEVALDDFGTGYASLNYIRKYDIDYIKIDKTFISSLTEQSDSYVLCEAITVMAHKLGLKVIAEGVETELQRRLLFQMGCDFGQGYLFSYPVEMEQFKALQGRIL